MDNKNINKKNNFNKNKKIENNDKKDNVIKIFSLGGLNENGKNMYVIEVNDDILVFDAGLKYADDTLYGIDYILPNFDYIKDNIDRVKGIFLTHGHNENMGAIPDIISSIPSIKVYGTKFTLEVLKKELEIDKISSDNLILIEAHKNIKFNDYSVFPVSVTHSIPDSVGYVVSTRDGAIVYTGDYLFDSTAKSYYTTDIGKLAYVGKQGVLCLLSESMYAEKDGFTAPDHRTSSKIKEVFYKNEGRVIYNVFAAHIYVIQEIFDEISKTDRKIVVMGKTLQNIVMNSIELGYLNISKDKIGDLSNVNDNNIVILVSNEREKLFSNIERMLNGYDKFIKIKDTDTIVFAEPITESTEKGASTISDMIARRGAEVITYNKKDLLLHHASKEDIMLMINLCRPKYFMPVKGEYKDMDKAKDCALNVGIKKENIILNLNGDVTTFVNGNLVSNGEKIKTDDILVDGNTITDIGEAVLKDREILANSGIVIIACTIDKTKKTIIETEIVTRGFVYVRESGELLKSIKDKCNETIIKYANGKNKYIEYNKIKMELREKLGIYLYKQTECKPMIIAVFQEV